MRPPVVEPELPETIVFEIGPEKNKFFISPELLKASGCLHRQEDISELLENKKCNVSAFGVFANWLHSKTVLIDLKVDSETEKQNCWVFLAQCWQVAEFVQSDQYKQALALTMMNFCKSKANNYPMAESQDAAAKIVGDWNDEFWEVFADCHLYHWTNDDDWAEFDESEATETMSRYFVRRLARLADLKNAQKDVFLWDDWKRKA